MAYERAPAFQFYPQDFLADDHVEVMPSSAVGCYWLLCCHAWLKQKLPNDMETLRKLARYRSSRSSFEKRVWIYVVQCFRLTPEGWIHPRLERERQKQAIFRENGRKGGIANAKQKASKRQAELQANLKSSSSSSIKNKNSLVTTNGVISTVSDPAKVVKNKKAVPAAHTPVNGHRMKTPPNLRVLTKLAHEILNDWPDETFADWKENLKLRCANLKVTYDAESAGKALESAIAQQQSKR